MADREKVISEFERCIDSFSPADTSDEHFKCVCEKALELLKEQGRQLKEYHKADTFLTELGWMWEGR